MDSIHCRIRFDDSVGPKSRPRGYLRFTVLHQFSYSQVLANQRNSVSHLLSVSLLSLSPRFMNILDNGIVIKKP